MNANLPVNDAAAAVRFAAAFNADGDYLEWAIAGALAVADVVVAHQASRLGRLGAGCFLPLLNPTPSAGG